ncbi:MAG: GGDEF domain-containing protein [Gammaproteobacteria bacterium]|nr:GGDEF domain-containing protein [Gammaproteobacteria bacterium]NNF50271.1 GGDEF domain-containing protein [Woeseiaceae bacterium]MBT8095233.1 GGDEF domain-containing protein [Gammaproteobacteria bacterium]MBT8105642.1 GGDEF domain-containing protein [Gammaproteobacteria bacterium]NNK25656.1 GGDEF domain-containing protein [Woeseiaceae bacterium]
MRDNAAMQEAALVISDYKRSLLDSLQLFKDVQPEAIHEWLQQCDRRDLGEGETLLSPDVRNENVYVVLSGSLNVHVGSEASPILTTMEPGDCVGEMSIIEDSDPSAYVIGAEATHLLVIHQSILWGMVDASHEFAKNLLVVLSKRVRSHNRVIASNYGELREFERHATTDALTNLANRHAMETAFPKLIEMCLNKAQPVSLMMIDVDNFKQFNDMLGHVAGDRALSVVARVLKQQFRQRDLLARYGGDEFAVLLPDVNLEEAVAIGERVRRAITGETDDGEDSLIRIPVCISMGVAELNPDGSLDALLRDADEALYRAKRAGRDKVST